MAMELAQMGSEAGLVAESGGAWVESAAVRTPEDLARIVAEFAARDGWMDRVRLRVEGRWYERLHLGEDHDLWVISWLPGQSTGFHDHGESAGAFVVVMGELEEHRPGEAARVIGAGEARAFGAAYAHDVKNESQAPAVSIHAYSPPLDEMNEYELEEGRLVARGRAEEAGRLEDGWRVERRRAGQQAGAMSVEQMLAAARARLRRVTAAEAFEAMTRAGAVLVDIRPASQRTEEGAIAGAVVVERNVLEWRFDPASSARLAVATDHDVEVIVVCSEGYTSSLAAAALQDLGLWRATDVVGGFAAWQAAGLPVESGEGASQKS